MPPRLLRPQRMAFMKLRPAHKLCCKGSPRMRILTVLLTLIASQLLASNCYSQDATSVSRDEGLSKFTAADRQCEGKLGDLERDYNQSLQTLNSEYQAGREALQKQQIKLLRDRIVELQSKNKAGSDATDFATVWKWDEFPAWRLVFEGDDTWMEGDRSRWTETGRSNECIYLHDEERNMFGMLYHNAFFYRQNVNEAWTMVSGSWMRDKVQAEADLSSFAPR